MRAAVLASASQQEPSRARAGEIGELGTREPTRLTRTGPGWSAGIPPVSVRGADIHTITGESNKAGGKPARNLRETY